MERAEDQADQRGRWIFALLVIYVLVLAFATLDDILGWGILAPLFKG